MTTEMSTIYETKQWHGDAALANYFFPNSATPKTLFRTGSSKSMMVVGI
jgi:hypothetical protein